MVRVSCRVTRQQFKLLCDGIRLVVTWIIFYQRLPMTGRAVTGSNDNDNGNGIDDTAAYLVPISNVINPRVGRPVQWLYFNGKYIVGKWSYSRRSKLILIYRACAIYHRHTTSLNLVAWLLAAPTALLLPHWGLDWGLIFSDSLLVFQFQGVSNWYWGDTFQDLPFTWFALW